MSENAKSDEVAAWERIRGILLTAAMFAAALCAALVGMALSSTGLLGEFPVVLPVLSVFVAVSLLERCAELLMAWRQNSKEGEA